MFIFYITNLALYWSCDFELANERAWIIVVIIARKLYLYHFSLGQRWHCTYMNVSKFVLISLLFSHLDCFIVIAIPVLWVPFLIRFIWNCFPLLIVLIYSQHHSWCLRMWSSYNRYTCIKVVIIFGIGLQSC